MDFFKTKGYTCGCPVGNLAQELGDLSPVFQKRLNNAINAMAENYTKVLSEAQTVGEIPMGMDVKEAGYFIVASWHGALIRMKVLNSIEPLKNHKKFILNHVLKS